MPSATYTSDEFAQCKRKFFLPPCPVSQLPDDLKDSGERPTLHLLRRDLQELYREERFFEPDNADKHKAPYLAAMGIFTGLDLMAKFYSRNPKNGKVFKGFLSRVCGARSADACFMWELRNALHHSYSLHLQTQRQLKFTTAPFSAGQNWHTMSEGYSVINFWGLKWHFLQSINSFELWLQTAPPASQEFFVERYKAAGRIYVAGNVKL